MKRTENKVTADPRSLFWFKEVMRSKIALADHMLLKSCMWKTLGLLFRARKVPFHCVKGM